MHPAKAPRQSPAARRHKDAAREPALRTMSALGPTLDAPRHVSAWQDTLRENSAHIDVMQHRIRIGLHRRIDPLLGDGLMVD